MIEYGFERKFHDLKTFEVGNFSIFFGFVITLKASSQNFVENHQLNVIYHIFKN